MFGSLLPPFLAVAELFVAAPFINLPWNETSWRAERVNKNKGLSVSLSLSLSVESVQFDNGREVVRLRLLRYRSSGFNFLIWRCVGSRKALQMRASIYPHSSCVQQASTATTGQSQEWRSVRGDSHRRRAAIHRSVHPTQHPSGMPFKSEDTFYGDGSQRMYGLVMMIGQPEKAPAHPPTASCSSHQHVRDRLPKEEGLSSQTVRVMLHTVPSASRPAQGRQLSGGHQSVMFLS